MEVDPFPASDFDDWASTYDQSVLDEASFPFWGYRQALGTVVRLAAVQPGMAVLDVGTGTANLAQMCAQQGCRLWTTDFSPAMLDVARRKLPQAQYLLADFRQGWPAGLPLAFDRIVSAYVFHHVALAQKVSLCAEMTAHLAPQGKLVIADVAFPHRAGMEDVRRQVGEEWEEEFYWLADEAVIALQQAGLQAGFTPVSACAGVFVVEQT
ncbi:MAG TPA: class I SAM-dependent methyltransferase [Anaerolineales bacterium]|nr:class I SAM-dependent methyltransferase [Anaerolineales bacterium]